MDTTVLRETPVAIQDPVLAAVVDRLIGVYEPERIYLFGSHARGDTGPNSDYDLMVVVPDSASPERQAPASGYQAIWRIGTAVDLLVWTHARFHDRLSLKASLPATVVREGRLLYGG